MKSKCRQFLIALRLGSKNDTSVMSCGFIRRDPDGGITSMCHTNHRREEKKVVIRYLLQTSFPLSRGVGTLHNFIVFDINLCRSICPQPDKQTPPSTAPLPDYSSVYRWGQTDGRKDGRTDMSHF